MPLDNKIRLIVVFTESLSTFVIRISSEGRKCDFFVRHNGEYLNLASYHNFFWIVSIRKHEMVIACPNSSTHVWWCSSLSQGAWNCAIFARYYVPLFDSVDVTKMSRRCVDSSVDVRYASCDFLANRYKADIAHRPTNRLGRCAMMMHPVWRRKNCVVSKPPKLVWNECSHWAKLIHIFWIIFHFDHCTFRPPT